MQKHINIITLGCSKNLVDSEKIMGNIDSDKFYISHESPDFADIIIVNTCGFINDAKEESIDTLLQYAHAKSSGKIEKLIITGCLSQRYKSELQKEIPEVDAWFGVDDTDELIGFVNNTTGKVNDDNRIITTPKHYAYLKIAEGCDRTCSFCAIPLIRGKYRSRTIDNIVKEANMLAGKGVKELLLIAQDISYYGIDLDSRSLLPELLDELVKVNGIEWIRLHYAYPLNFSDRIIELIATHDKICKYLDIPLQHINSEILKSMKRGVDKNRTTSLIQRLRDKVPCIALRTTMLVGYPNETEKEYDELLDFIREAKFDRLGVFTYSAEEGTPASNIKDVIPEETKQQRAAFLMTVQQQISLELNMKKIGKVFKTIIDRKEGEIYIGRTEFDSPEVDNEVFIKADNMKLKPGMFCNVLIDNASEFELYGHPVILP